MSAATWNESILPVRLDTLRPLLNQTTERKLREACGNAFLVRSLSPEEGEDNDRPMTAAFDVRQIVTSTRSQQWVHLVSRTRRNAYDRFVSVGRTRNNDIVINHQTVSRFHAFIVNGEQPALYDAGSRHGTFVDGQKAPILGAGEPRPLKSCSVVRLGSVELTFFDAAGLLASLQ